eukprot:GHVO01017530.1.p1 GENE.GHVO01017530.1~~GHVO01017530.1.p1  ORF type:complete len:192 (+),score=40.47 GHVO01017530.1:63-638(+)
MSCRVGDFTLKSGIKSPYFMNLGKFCDGQSMAALAAIYADCIIQSGIEYTVLFGPAYKGIPIVSCVSCELYRRGRDVPFVYNRKEVKDHGEGGTLVGALECLGEGGKVLIIDDVITAGTAATESVKLIRDTGSTVAGLVVAFDRQEILDDRLSGAQRVSSSLSIPVIAATNLDEISGSQKCCRPIPRYLYR